MKLLIKIDTPSALKMVYKLEDFVDDIKSALSSSMCKKCSQLCGDPKKECAVSGGSSEVGLDSTWTLIRKKQNKKVPKNN
jgi:hypothetical protein